MSGNSKVTHGYYFVLKYSLEVDKACQSLLFIGYDAWAILLPDRNIPGEVVQYYDSLLIP